MDDLLADEECTSRMPTILDGASSNNNNANKPTNSAERKDATPKKLTGRKSKGKLNKQKMVQIKMAAKL